MWHPRDVPMVKRHLSSEMCPRGGRELAPSPIYLLGETGGHKGPWGMWQVEQQREKMSVPGDNGVTVGTVWSLPYSQGAPLLTSPLGISIRCSLDAQYSRSLHGDLGCSVLWVSSFLLKTPLRSFCYCSASFPPSLLALAVWHFKTFVSAKCRSTGKQLICSIHASSSGKEHLHQHFCHSQ